MLLSHRHLPEKAAAGAIGVGLVAVLGATMGGFGAATAFTAYSAHATSYLSEDPKACINCHIMNEQYNGWSSSAHHARASCNDCHVPHESLLSKYLVKAEHGYRHSKGFTFQDFHEPIQITPSSRAVVIDNCVRCHEAMTHEIRLTAGGGNSEETPVGVSGGVDCIHCHASVGHGPTR